VNKQKERKKGKRIISCTRERERIIKGQKEKKKWTYTPKPINNNNEGVRKRQKRNL
jgi:hypothetical protein